MGVLDFIDDLRKGITQQENPFKTIAKAFGDLGTRPIQDAAESPQGRWLGWLPELIGIPLLIVLSPLILIGLAIAWLVRKIMGAF